jgi:hypothetical protein
MPDAFDAEAFWSDSRGSEMVISLRTVIRWNVLDVWVKRRVADTTVRTIYFGSQK